MALAIGVVIVVAGAAAGAWELTGSGGAGAAAYRVIPAVRTTLTQALSATGTIAPKTTATLTFSASGQVTAVDTEVGQHLEEGQPLAIMDSPALKAQAAQAEASLAAAQSQLSQDQASTGTSSAQLDADQASVTAAQSQADSASSALAGATLTAPIDGIVTAVGYTAGEQLSGGSSGLIASTSSGVATFPVVIDVTGTPAGLYSGASATSRSSTASSAAPWRCRPGPSGRPAAGRASSTPSPPGARSRGMSPPGWPPAA